MLRDAISFLIELYVRRKRLGKFEVLPLDGKSVSLRTDLGHFTIDASQSSVTMGQGDTIRHVPFASICGLDYRRTKSSSALEDFIDESYGNIHSHIEWYVIGLLLVGGENIPMYKVGQYQIRAIYPQLQWIIDIWRKIGSYCGLYRDLGRLSSAVLHRIQDLFLAAGKHCSIREAEPDGMRL